ncbi:hypothetical protein Tco_0515131 [Tanacetum coccineum]
MEIPPIMTWEVPDSRAESTDELFLPAYEVSEPDDEIEVENPIEHEDETVPVSVYEVGESSTCQLSSRGMVIKLLPRLS